MILLNEQVVNDEYYRLEPVCELIRIQKAIFVYRDIFFSLDECGNIWQAYSAAICASWLFIPDDLASIIFNIESEGSFISYEEWSK